MLNRPSNISNLYISSPARLLLWITVDAKHIRTKHAYYKSFIGGAFEFEDISIYYFINNNNIYNIFLFKILILSDHGVRLRG